MIDVTVSVPTMVSVNEDNENVELCATLSAKREDARFLVELTARDSSGKIITQLVTMIIMYNYTYSSRWL